VKRATSLAIAALLFASCASADPAVRDSNGVSAPAGTEGVVDVPELDAGADASSSTEAEPVAPQPVTASTTPTNSTDDFPDILAAQATPEGDGAWRFDVTVSSPYDTPERYADAWRVVGPDGTEFGIRVLTHDHASEQPFTRSQNGIIIPDDVTTVTIEGRDQVNGWGGGTLVVDLTAEG